MSPTSESALPLLPDEFTGGHVGPYELIRRLSRGGMAEIFLAVRRGEGGFRKLVVIKRMLPEMARDEDFVARLLDEGKLMGNFSHPNIAQVFDVGRDGGDYFLVLEFVAGVSLAELLGESHRAQERLPVGFTLAIGRAAANALHHAHSFTGADGKPHPVIHRDVAPKNIMVSFEGDTKLLDFGVAKTQRHNTSVGVVIGTPAYMSPEQANLERMDPRSDVFSLAVTIHEALTSARLFAGDSVPEQLDAVNHRPIPAPSSANSEVPAELDQVLLRALARPREERFPTARELARALESVPEKVWSEDRVAAVVQRFFPRRREQLRLLLQSVQDGLTAPDILARSVVTTLPETATATPPAPTVVVPSQTVRNASTARWGVGALGAGILIAGAVAIYVRGAWFRPRPATLTPVTVAPAPAPPPAVASAPPEPAADDASPEPVAPTKPHVAPSPARTAAPRRHAPEDTHAAAATGSLWVRVRPWAKVYVDGKLKGETPLDPFGLPAGRHVVLLVNDALKVKKTYAVDVPANEQREVRAVLDEP